MQSGGVAPIFTSSEAALAATAQLGGMEEKFAFQRAISRLHEMQAQSYTQLRSASY